MGQHDVGSSYRDQTRASPQRASARENSGAALPERTCDKENMPESAFVGFDGANQRQLVKFIRPSPTERSLPDFFDERGRRTDGANLQSTDCICILRKQLAYLGRSKGDSPVCKENGTFGMLPVRRQPGRSIHCKDQCWTCRSPMSRQTIDVFDCLRDQSSGRAAQARAQKRVNDDVRMGNRMPSTLPSSFICDGEDSGSRLEVASEICARIAVHLRRIGEEAYKRINPRCFQVSRGD